MTIIVLDDAVHVRQVAHYQGALAIDGLIPTRALKTFNISGLVHAEVGQGHLFRKCPVIAITQAEGDVSCCSQTQDIIVALQVD